MKLNINYKDFLSDDLFVYWRIHPTEALTAFWKKFISENEHLREPFQEAVSAFDEIRKDQDRFRLDEASVNRQLQGRIREFRMRKWRILYTSAAAVLLLTLITVLYTVNRKETIPDKQIASIGEVMSQDKVQLITGNQVVDMENNATVQLSEKENAVIRDSLSQKEIDLKDNQTNRLIVPFGKRSSVLLADGSMVYVNSGTELEFPSAFSGKTREISVKGEIFIEVARQGHPFIIHTPQSQITVYGTSFNVSSYTDEQSESVVLVNGSVEVKTANGSLMLKPSEMAKIDNGNIQRQQVDVMEYISWKDGYMQLNKAPLTDLLKKIGRYYNVEFNYEASLNLQNQSCSGKLFLSDNLNDVLESFSKMTFLDYKKLNEGVIYIDKPSNQ
ncbi:MAG: transrane sensor [Anaerophaga sp.]|nr:transrane sensor [Anaerophaga sp.]